MGFLTNLFKNNKLNIETNSDNNALKIENSDIIENNDKNIAKQEESKEDETMKMILMNSNKKMLN